MSAEKVTLEAQDRLLHDKREAVAVVPDQREAAIAAKRTWIPVGRSPQSESLPNPGVTEGAIWLVGDTIVRLPR
ncbi:MAG: hypothetical protein ACYDDU_14865 [Dermatophilaceae bacterium]